jgi:hypothetical protein
MSNIFVVITTAFLLVLVAMCFQKSTDSQSQVAQPVTKNDRNSNGPCMKDSEIADTLQRLVTEITRAEHQTIRATFREKASQSPECRKQVVERLITALNESDRDLLLNRESFFLWYYGTKLLVDLKAVEAMDLFIANFNLHDGTPFPFNHHPALGAAIDLGEAAIPALKSVLEGNNDDSTKRFAVFCLAQIGGKIAKQALRDRLPFETNCCIRDCILTTLRVFENKTFPDHITDEKRASWYATFMCDCDPAMRIKIVPVKR